MAIKKMRIKATFQEKKIRDLVKNFYFKGERLFFTLCPSLFI